jgi:hypothetical protein
MADERATLVARYLPERTKNGYVARIQIELMRASGQKHDFDYTLSAFP